jgi:hypothetical protein
MIETVLRVKISKLHILYELGFFESPKMQQQKMNNHPTDIDNYVFMLYRDCSCKRSSQENLGELVKKHKYNFPPIQFLTLGKAPVKRNITFAKM